MKGDPIKGQKDLALKVLNLQNQNPSQMIPQVLILILVRILVLVLKAHGREKGLISIDSLHDVLPAPRFPHRFIHVHNMSIPVISSLARIVVI